MREVYYDPGAAALHLAALYLRELGLLESMYGNSPEALFLTQLSVDLRQLAEGGPPHCTASWRVFEARFPELFSTTRVAA
jgi:hypothetical protein